jgi:lysozyme family protein
MANYKTLIPFILQWEGGFVDDPDDTGGATNKGVTIATFKKVYGATSTVEQLKKITDEQWTNIFKKEYWDRWRGDDIVSQSIANIVVDWVWLSGTYGITLVQRLLSVVQDGVVGPKTITALNAQDAKKLFDNIKTIRVQYINDIIKKTPKKEKYRKGWMNRLNALTFEG